MRTNYSQMDRLVGLARRNGANLRVNAYQAVKTDAYHLAYAECSIRFNPRGQVIPCVYWPSNSGSASVIGDLDRLGAMVMHGSAFRAARFQPTCATQRNLSTGVS